MLKNFTLEMSLKPFKKITDEYINQVCERMFEQWKPLLLYTEQVSVLLWTADGGEILDYRGISEDEIEWGKYIGTANPDADPPEWDPEGESLSAKSVLYINEPPVITYGTLKRIVTAIKNVGEKVLNKKIRVGDTFDIGPEFAKANFKYIRHREVCKSTDGSTKCFINSFAKLSADDYMYKAYPDGIPDKTPFAEFFANQVKGFFEDMGFDYLWLSNGVGYAQETWNTKGCIFDGKAYHTERIDEVRENVLNFWNTIKKICPNMPVEARGTNFSAGIDYAVNAVPLYNIYENVKNLLPPPNSPWAALDGNFGLELMGYMSRMAEIPGDEYLFRYYLHDPWWANSPWYDRYEGQPHDIYLPLAVSRIDKDGNVKNPTHVNILSIDNSWGNMPDMCVYEPMPHFMRAIRNLSDRPSPLVWVYPLREYTTAKDTYSLKNMFSNDWFITGAINNSLPLSGVISTDNFIGVQKDIFEESVIVSPVPQEGSDYEREIISYTKSGGRVLFYGDVTNAGETFKELINVRIGDGVQGEIILDKPERFSKKPMHFYSETSSGELNTYLLSHDGAKAIITTGEYVLATSRENYAWYRAPVSASFSDGSPHLNPDDTEKWVLGEEMILYVLDNLGYKISVNKKTGRDKSPVIMINRSNNGYFFSTYMPETVVETEFSLPQGAPLFMGYETRLKNNTSSYSLPRAEHRECRVFVKQEEESTVICKEMQPGSAEYRRRILVRGLKNAEVTFYPESYCVGDAQILLNSNAGLSYTSEKVNAECFGNHYVIKNVTGQLVLSMPMRRETDENI